MRPKKALMKFLTASLQTRMRLTEPQIGLLEQNLSKDKILERISDAQWEVLREEEQNGVTIYFLFDPFFLCSCSRKPSHFHNKKPCCGDLYCCPEAKLPEAEALDEVEVEIAWKIGQIRQMLQERKELNVKVKQ